MATNKQKKRARVRQKMANREPDKLKQIAKMLDQVERLEAEALASGEKPPTIITEPISPAKEQNDQEHGPTDQDQK